MKISAEEKVTIVSALTYAIVAAQSEVNTVNVWRFTNLRHKFLNSMRGNK